MDWIAAMVGSFGGTFGFCFLLCSPHRSIISTSLIGTAGYMTFFILHKLEVGMLPSYFFATVVIAVLCELEARRKKMPASVFLIGALVPLVPGYSFYNAMLELVRDNGMRAAADGVEAAMIVGAIAAGAAIVSSLSRMQGNIHRKYRH